MLSQSFLSKLLNPIKSSSIFLAFVTTILSMSLLEASQKESIESALRSMTIEEIRHHPVVINMVANAVISNQCPGTVEYRGNQPWVVELSGDDIPVKTFGPPNTNGGTKSLLRSQVKAHSRICDFAESRPGSPIKS